jgi:phosphate transport system substrate-binding protein
MKRVPTVAGAITLVVLVAEAQARDQIRIVGSSTVHPFTSVVAERFGATSGMKIPVVESTGTGGGFRLFCAGVGAQTPDFTNASRRIRKAEFDACAAAGVTEITEMPIGLDGIALATSKLGPSFDLTLAQLWLALAKEVPIDGRLAPNPFKTWNEIDQSLPYVAIVVLGPPPTSGTRDSFNELAMGSGCQAFPEIRAIADGSARDTACQTVREDGVFVEAGENDNLIVRKLQENPKALGVFGFSFLDQNRASLTAATLDGVAPVYETILDGSYPLSRPMYVYAKNAHVGVIPGMREFTVEYLSDAAMGPGGYLAGKGLIVLPAEQLVQVREQVSSLTPLSM